jgi:hypothetical protein
MITNSELVICTVETQAQHPELFHYTKRAAFESIVKSNVFWASHFRDMDDKKEVLLMQDRLPRAVAPRFEEILAGLNRHDRRLLKKSGGSQALAKDFVKSLYGATFFNKGGLSALDAFVVSFSTHAHDGEFEREHGLRSQWTEYASDDGFCIVLDTSAMAERLVQEMDSRYWVRLALDPVRYADKPVEELFPELVNASADTLRRFMFGIRNPEMAVPEFLAGATLLKDAAFRREREVRVVAIPGSKRLSDQAAKEHPHDFQVTPLPEVRTQPGSGRRFVSLFETLGSKLPIKRVIVGPSARQKENFALATSLIDPASVSLPCCML